MFLLYNLKKDKETQDILEKLEQHLPNEVKNYLKNKNVYFTKVESPSELLENRSKKGLILPVLIRHPYIINSIEEFGDHITDNLLTKDSLIISNTIVVDKDFEEYCSSIVSSYLMEEILNSEKLNNFLREVDRETLEHLKKIGQIPVIRRTYPEDIVFYTIYGFLFPKDNTVSRLSEFIRESVILNLFPNYFENLYKVIEKIKESVENYKINNQNAKKDIEKLKEYRNLLKTLRGYEPLINSIKYFTDENNPVKKKRLEILLDEFKDLVMKVPVKDLNTIKGYDVLKKYIKGYQLEDELSIYDNLKNLKR